MRFPESSKKALVDFKEFIQLQKLAENGWIENPPLKMHEYMKNQDFSNHSNLVFENLMWISTIKKIDS